MRGGSRSLAVTVVIAAIALVGCLVAAFVLRPRHPSADRPVSPGRVSSSSSVSANPPLQCDHGPCTQLAATAVAGDTVQLLTDSTASSGRVRITGPNVNSLFETTVSQLGVKLTAGSLSCVAGSVPACMVSGAYQGNSALGEVFVFQDGDWARANNFFFADGGYLALHQAGNGAEPTVLAVRRQCTAGGPSGCTTGKVYLEVYSLGQDSQGCTHPVAAVNDLPGWPNPTPDGSTLRTCPT